MLRTWHVFWREYWGNLTRRSFLLFTFGFPAFVIFMPIVGGLLLTMAIASAMPEVDPRPVGVVDEAGILPDNGDPPAAPVDMLSFDSLTAAKNAYDAHEIQAYYHILPDYWQSGRVVMTYEQPPIDFVDDAVAGWITSAVEDRVPEPILRRFRHGPQIVHEDLSGEERFDFTDFLVPGLLFIIFYFVQLTSSFTAGFMFDSIASESNDRTIEILITSITPLQFLTGKVLGLLLVGLTQLLAWASLGVIIVLWGSARLGFDLLGLVSEWEHMGLLISILLATYAMNQLLSAAMGLLQVNSGSGPLFFNTMNWVVGIGWLYALALVPPNPHAPLAVALSFFPLTSPTVMLIRVVVAEVPTWQIILSQVILWGTNVATIFWLRRLLQSNLVAYAPRFRLRTWLSDLFKRKKLLHSQGQ